MFTGMGSRVEAIVTSLIGSAILAAILAVGFAIWAAAASVALPVVVAMMLAVVGGTLGLSAFVSRRFAPRPIEVETHGLAWRDSGGNYPSPKGLCTEHRAEVFNRSQSGNRVFIQPLQRNSDTCQLFCPAGGGHVVDVDLGRLDEAFASAASLIDLERVKRRFPPPDA